MVAIFLFWKKSSKEKKRQEKKDKENFITCSSLKKSLKKQIFLFLNSILATLPCFLGWKYQKKEMLNFFLRSFFREKSKRLRKSFLDFLKFDLWRKALIWMEAIDFSEKIGRVRSDSYRKENKWGKIEIYIKSPFPKIKSLKIKNIFKIQMLWVWYFRLI